MSNPAPKPAPGNLTPFKPGHVSSRRSSDVDRALRMARKLTSEAVAYCGKVLRAEGEDTRHRIKAAEIILQHGMPRDAAHRRALEGISSLKIEFVAADGSLVSFQQDAAPAPAPEVPTIEVDFEPV